MPEAPFASRQRAPNGASLLAAAAGAVSPETDNELEQLGFELGDPGRASRTLRHVPSGRMILD
jgi:hypothetical protein